MLAAAERETLFYLHDCWQVGKLPSFFLGRRGGRGGGEWWILDWRQHQHEGRGGSARQNLKGGDTQHPALPLPYPTLPSYTHTHTHKQPAEYLFGLCCQQKKGTFNPGENVALFCLCAVPTHFLASCTRAPPGRASSPRRWTRSSPSSP